MSIVAALLLLTASSGLSGCDALAAVDGRLVKARFVLPARPTVILVEPLSENPEEVIFARQIAARATSQLRDNPELVAATMIDTAEVVALQDADRETFAVMPIDAIGRALGAETVIVAQITKADLNAQSGLFRPESAVAVRVIDALTGTQLFPRPGGDPNKVDGRPPSYPMTAGGTYVQDRMSGESRTTDSRALRALADETGLVLARLFYQWTEKTPGERASDAKADFQKSQL